MPHDNPTRKTEPPRFVMVPKFLFRAELSLTAKCLLVILADHRNPKTGQCNPKIETLTNELRVTRAGIKRALTELRKHRLIETVKGQRSNSYRVTPMAQWRKILPAHIEPAENPAGSLGASAPAHIEPAEPRRTLFTELDQLNKTIEQASGSLPRAREGVLAAAATACSPACPNKTTNQTPNGAVVTGTAAERIVGQVLAGLEAEGVPLPPRFIRNEYGRELRNPASQSLEAAIANALERIRQARKPAAYARTVILDELKKGDA